MRDHLGENVRRMRQIQRQAKEREANAHQPVKALWKSEKYSGISSKIKEDIKVGSSFSLVLNALKCINSEGQMCAIYDNVFENILINVLFY